ncbi:MAG: nucleoside diphosphate kinase regulator [Brucellaceae bacterium]|nr:nucleoside diphosphate kinase regulator [Brucellaceae bacterium]
MASRTNHIRKPTIIMSRSDHERLSKLADSLSARSPEVADQLFNELDRTRVVDDRKIGANVVQIGSLVTFVTEKGEERTVTLVLPIDADIANATVSVFTPIGAALIGLSSGQSIDWMGRDGRSHRLTVIKVSQPTAASPGDDSSDHAGYVK